MAKAAAADAQVLPDVPAVRELLASKARQSGLSERFGWALTDTRTLDQYVADYLALNVPDDSLHPSRLARHLGEASSLLDGCLARQDQIFALEASAITAGMELLLGETTHSADLALATVQLQAAARQAALPDLAGALEQLRSQFAARQDSRRARLALHNQDGGPLNYSQRVTRQRELFADDIRAAYERLRSARKGLHSSHLARDLPKVPEWDPASSANLMKLVLWTRNAIRAMELRAEAEVTQTIVLAMAQRGYLHIDWTTDGAGIDGGTIQQFELKADLFKRFEDNRVRLVGFGAAMSARVDVGSSVAGSADHHYEDTIRAQAGQYSYSAVIRLPTQKAAFAGEPVVQWPINQLRLIDRIPTWRDGSELSHPPDIQPIVENVDPVGAWEVVILDRRIGPDGTIKVLDMNEPASNSVNIRPTELFLALTVAGKRKA